MHYVYILKSDEDTYLYVGYTNDIKKRLEMHNSGKVRSTKLRLPLKLIHYEAFLNKYDALEREKYYKTGWGKRYIKKLLSSQFRD